MYREPQMPSLIEELQRDALDSKVSVNQLLQKCRVVAVKLDVKQPADWVRLELNGYGGKDMPVPEYRILYGRPRVRNPFHGYQPLIFDDLETQKLVSQVPFANSVGEIEHMLTTIGDGEHFSYSPEAEALIRPAIQFGLPPSIYIGSSQLKKVIEAVRGKVLEWTLELEKAGICGDGMTFSTEEKQKAQQMVTYNGGNHIHGNVDHSQVGTVKSTQQNISNGVDVAAVQQIVVALRHNSGQLNLSPERADELKAELQTLEAQTQSPKPKASILREGLLSVRSILEETTANVLAAGMLHEIAKLLAH
jgi:AbiTii